MCQGGRVQPIARHRQALRATSHRTCIPVRPPYSPYRARSCTPLDQTRPQTRPIRARSARPPLSEWWDRSAVDHGRRGTVSWLSVVPVYHYHTAPHHSTLLSPVAPPCHAVPAVASGSSMSLVPQPNSDFLSLLFSSASVSNSPELVSWFFFGLVFSSPLLFPDLLQS